MGGKIDEATGQSISGLPGAANLSASSIGLVKQPGHAMQNHSASRDRVVEVGAIIPSVPDTPGKPPGGLSGPMAIPAYGERLTEIEDCSLIEQPKEIRLQYSLEDCPGYCAEPPLLTPNADHDKPRTIIDACNAVSGHQIASVNNAFGHLIPQGYVGIYEHNGKIKMCGDKPGRYYLNLSAVRSGWLTKRQSLDVQVIQKKSLLIVRVPIGKIGFAIDNGNPLLLDSGTHVFNTGLVQYVKFVPKSDPYIQHGPLNLLRVSRGKFAKVWVSDEFGSMTPRLLQEGFHCICHPLFKFDKFVDVKDQYIMHGAVNVLQVEKGKMAKVFHNNMPRLLGYGTHLINSTNFEYAGMARMSDKIIRHGTMTIVRVNLGEIGVAWDRNQPCFIDDGGLYAFNSPDFTFVEHVSANERVIELGAKKILMVYTGEVGISYDHGELRILNHGRHIIDASTHLFEGFLSTQQRSIRLVTISREQSELRKKQNALSHTALGPIPELGPSSSSSSKSSKSQTARKSSKIIKPEEDDDMMICETKDLVKVGVRADVFYSITDPEKVITRVKVDEIDDLLRETAIATLTNIIRSTALNEIAQSKLPSAVSEQKALAAQNESINMPSAPLFFDKAHDEFISKLHDDFLNKYGLDIANIRIESFKICDQELADSISKQALTTAQTENELANLQGKTEIATAEQHRVAEVQNIAAEAEARAMKVRVDAENARKLAIAKAEAESAKIRKETEAAAEAEAVIIKARAEAEAIRLVAEAEAKRNELLSQSEIGQQISLLNIYAEMMAKANQGVEKVVYCDPSISGGSGSALALPSLTNLNRDLHALTTIGLAAGEQVGVVSHVTGKPPIHGPTANGVSTKSTASSFTAGC